MGGIRKSLRFLDLQLSPLHTVSEDVEMLSEDEVASDFSGFPSKRTDFLGCSANKDEGYSAPSYNRGAFVYHTDTPTNFFESSPKNSELKKSSIAPDMIRFPSSWNYEIDKFTFYRAVTKEYLDSEWYTTRFQAEKDDISKFFDTHILHKTVKLPSAEDLLLQCYSFLMMQQCRKIHPCEGCNNNHPSQVQHLDGCMQETEKIVFLNEDEAYENIKDFHLTQLYNNVRDHLNIERVFMLYNVKPFCKSKRLIMDIHPAFLDLFSRVYKNILDGLC